MVVKLPVPGLDEAIFFANVLEQRKKGNNGKYFDSISHAWLNKLKEYNDVGGDPTKLSPSIIAEVDKDKLINLYSDTNKGSYHVPHIYKLRRPTPRLSLCPACGEEGTPNTLDHYLPKNKYPEYSIHLKNLVPMCDICQGIKLESFIDSSGRRKYLHPYFDVVSQPLMKIKISQPFKSPVRFELQVNPSLPAELAAQVTRHLAGLNIPARFEDYCRTKYIQLLRNVSYSRTHLPQDISLTLQSFLHMAEQTALNSWPAIFYRSIIENVELMEYLRNGVLPDDLGF